MGFCVVLLSLPSNVSAHADEYGFGVNGNQELLADHSHSKVYFSDPDGSSVWIWDGHSESFGAGIPVGLAPMSLSVDRPGKELFVACSQSNETCVVDTAQCRVVRNLSLDFSPLCVRVGSHGRLYLTSPNDSLLRVINSTTGDLIATIDMLHSSIIEVNPNGTEMIAVAREGYPTGVGRYDISNDTPIKVASDSGGVDQSTDIGTLVVDWQHGRVFIQSYYFIYLLDLETLNRIQYRQAIYGVANGITLSPDGSVLYGTFSGVIQAFNATDLSQMEYETVASSGPIAVSPNGTQLYVGAPFPTIVEALTYATPVMPTEGQRFAYTPNYLDFGLHYGLFRPQSINALNVSLDDIRMEPVQDASGDFNVTLLSTLSNGTHTIKVAVETALGTTHSSWSFEVDRADPSLPRPSIVPGSPSPGEDTMAQYSEITCYASIPSPQPLNTEVQIFLDGSYIFTYGPFIGTGQCVGTFSSLGYGVHTVEAVVLYDGSRASVTWNFTYRMAPQFTMTYPTPDGSVVWPLTYVEARYDPGIPAAVLYDYAVHLDGVLLPSHLNASGILHANVTFDVPVGDHGASFYLNSSVYKSEGYWRFTVVAPPEPRQPSVSPWFPVNDSEVTLPMPYVVLVYDPGYPQATLENFTIWLDGVRLQSYLDGNVNLVGNVSSELNLGVHYARCAINTSAGSFEVNWQFSVIPRPPSPPSAPLNLAAVPGIRNVTLTWQPPQFSDGSEVSGYEVIIGTSSGDSYTRQTAQTTLALTDLTEGLGYFFAVRAQNAMGWGPWTGAVSAIPFAPPSAPYLLAKAGDGQVALNWSVPEYSGPGALVYHLFRDHALVWSGGDTWFVDVGLTNGLEYSYEVSASNDVAWGPNSTAINATPQPPTQPVVSFYVSLNGSSTAVTMAQENQSLVLNANASYSTIVSFESLNFTWSLGNGETRYGSYVVGFAYSAINTYLIRLSVLDPYGNEANRTMYFVVTSSPRPDLRVLSIETSPSILIRGQQGTITVNITNFGNAVADTPRVEFYILDSAGNRTLIGDSSTLTISGVAATGLEPGQQGTITYTWTPEKTMNAVLLVVAITPREINRADNTDSVDLVVVAPGGDFNYRLIESDTEAEITGYVGVGGNVIVPSTIEGKPVTSIGDNAFFSCGSLVSVIVPEGVTSIGASAFDTCSNLTSVALPTSVTSIGWRAFNSCYGLISVNIPYGVTAIAAQTFNLCYSLKSIVIPNSVVSIGDGAFYSCNHLIAVNIPGSVRSVGALTFDACIAATCLNMSEGVESFSYSAFASMNSLRSVTIPGSVTSIGDSAFRYCSSLRSITFLGAIAPTSVGYGWILETPDGILGHAYADSDFPAPGGIFYGLTMGAVISFPSAPINLISTPYDAQVKLEWSEPTHNGTSPIICYHVYRALSATGN
ncbi:MAG TPA: leucine-rich repeat protein, partial [Methanomassiliicoccales archaeon]|nr:leucine-rich repeat protein [Methanomassiliicoccales archaeon]